MDFLYKLTLVERLVDGDSWTETDDAIVQEHFQHLKRWTDEGIVKLAGRTTNEGAPAFGLVLFHADSETKAEQMMNKDPAIEQGIMQGELFPFHVALASQINVE